MMYNHGLEEKKFKEEWAEKAKEYREAGMTDQQIKSIYMFDRQVFNSDRKYRRNTVGLFANQNNNILCSDDEYLLSDKNKWLDDLENEEAYKRLCSLPKSWLTAFSMYKIEGYTQKEISSILTMEHSKICRVISKIAEILFFYSENAILRPFCGLQNEGTKM